MRWLLAGLLWTGTAMAGPEELPQQASPTKDSVQEQQYIAQALSEFVDKVGTEEEIAQMEKLIPVLALRYQRLKSF
jgi:hypothetical protein